MTDSQHVLASNVRHRALATRVTGMLRQVVEHHAPDPAEHKGGLRKRLGWWMGQARKVETC